MKNIQFLQAIGALHYPTLYHEYENFWKDSVDRGQIWILFESIMEPTRESLSTLLSAENFAFLKAFQRCRCRRSS